ncbi:PREDICTED: E3 ubiquitin-protein ligase RHA1B-like [Tarenaya hassleriana]|uniref:E3 ubiquitin-protein ligase RHA1B-like n=1 Tax=Tarenaya hassleriana TaxID=28532 RepID=UPI00053C4D39|nr:PREDICTED: E3 ubiquitin-protein ligase RHA1B-like [Tarenaya hassleriana]
MGFPVGYTELLLPGFFLHALSFLGLIRKLISTVFRVMGLHDFLEPNISWPDPPPFSSSSSATCLPESCLFPEAKLAGEILPVVRFSNLNRPSSGSESCAVCLYEFEDEDEIRRLTNCRHIFHRSCLDRWMMGYNQMTCPLCRTQFIPDDLQEAFNQRIWSESGVSDQLLGESY